MTEFAITADSKPVLDGWGAADYWTLADWRRWHERMVAKYKKDFANKQFRYYWNSQTADMNPYNWGKYDKVFVDYLKKYGIDISNFLSKILVGTTSAVGSAGEVVETAGESAEKTAKILKLVIPSVVIVLVIIVIIVIYRKSKKV